MRKAMKFISWLVFLGFIALSSYANWEHGDNTAASFMLAVVPVGFAASVFILEGLIGAGRVSRWTFGAIGFVALCSGVASYLGLYGMAIDSGIGQAQGLLLPLSFDGVVLVASMGIRGFSLSHVPARAPRVKPVRVPAAAVPVSQDNPEPVSQPVVPAKDKVSRGPKEWDTEKAARLLSEGRPRKEIAELCGVTRKSVDRLAQKIANTEVAG